MIEGLKERLAALPTPALRALQVLGALSVLALGVLVVALVLPDGDAPQQSPTEVVEEVRAEVQADLYQAVLELPPSVVRRLAEDGDGLEGTLAVRDGEDCLGFRVEVGEGYVLTGDQGAVEVGPVEELPAEACQAAEPQVPAVPTGEPAPPEPQTTGEPAPPEPQTTEEASPAP